VRREYLGLLRHILEGRRGDTWRACRNVALVALGLPLFAVAWGWAPTFYFRFLDRLSSVLLDSMHLAANYACRRAGELLGEEERELGAAICLTGFMVTVEKINHERGPMCSVLRAREEDRRKLLEGAAASLKGSSSSGAYCSSRWAKPLRPRGLSLLEKRERMRGNM